MFMRPRRSWRVLGGLRAFLVAWMVGLWLVRVLRRLPRRALWVILGAVMVLLGELTGGLAVLAGRARLLCFAPSATSWPAGGRRARGQAQAGQGAKADAVRLKLRRLRWDRCFQGAAWAVQVPVRLHARKRAEMATLKQHRAAGARGETSALNGATPAELLARLDGHAKPGTPAASGQAAGAGNGRGALAAAGQRPGAAGGQAADVAGQRERDTRQPPKPAGVER